MLKSEVESRTQGLRPKPRTQKNPRPRPRTALARTDPLEAKNRNARGQGKGRRTQAQMLFKKKRSSQIFFRWSPEKNVFQKIFQALHNILTIQKIVLFSSRGLANFRGLEDSKPRPRTSLSRPRPRTSNVSSRTPPLVKVIQKLGSVCIHGLQMVSKR